MRNRAVITAAAGLLILMISGCGAAIGLGIGATKAVVNTVI